VPTVNGDVRDRVLREMRVEINHLAGQGMSVGEIEERVNDHHELTEAEQGLIELLTHHAVAEVKGHY
jgi:phosphoserine aminotransferase